MYHCASAAVLLASASEHKNYKSATLELLLVVPCCLLNNKYIMYRRKESKRARRVGRQIKYGIMEAISKRTDYTVMRDMKNEMV